MKEGEEMSPLDTSGSSITDEIFNTALSNLEFLSDDDQDSINGGSGNAS